MSGALLPVTAVRAQNPSPAIPPSVTAEVDALLHRPVREQEERTQKLAAQLQAIDQPLAVALRELAAVATAAAAAPGKPRTTPFAHHDAGKKGPKPGARVDDGLPDACDYVFGLGTIELHTQANANKAQLQLAARKAEWTAALLGVWPQADRAVAALQQQLDSDASADRFAAFLQSWRNGDESFYQALDRTAGTKDSVFFYDVMLGDFSTAFAKGDGGSAPLKGLQAAHDALHDAFLSYRQYRAFREAVAWSLVLPCEVPLPAHLQRYEQKAQGAYSLREQVVMVLATADFDPRAVAQRIVEHAAPLPQPLWRALYDPYPQWDAVFQAAQERMIADAGSTDAFLQKAKDAFAAFGTAVRGAAQGSDDHQQHAAPR